MIYALALLGAATLAVLMWKAFGPSTDSFGPGSPQGATRSKPIAPDDDPDFLRSIDQQRDQRPDEGE